MREFARVIAPFALATAFGLAGCARNTGSFDVDDPAQAKWNNLVALVSFKPLPRQPKPTDPIICPEIQILDGTAADRIYAPGSDQSNEAVRYQFSIEDVARDCRVEGGQLAIKIGVSGRILLGPAGSPGTFAAPIRVAVVHVADESPILSKLYQVPANVSDGQSEAQFTLITEPLTVPVIADFKENYTIKVGFDSAGGKQRPQAQTATTDTPVGAADDSTPMHHHHHHRHFGADSSGAGGSD